MLAVSRTLFLPIVAIVLLLGPARGQQPTDPGLSVGQEICTFGYVMDGFCIDDGVLLDAPQFQTLENPEQHSVHCLVDVPMCYETPFHILSDPRPDDTTTPTTYGPGWAVHDNDLILTLARQLGGECSTCNGTGTVVKGLRLEVRGTIQTLDPPVLEIASVNHLQGDAEGCVESASVTSDVTNTNPTTESGVETPAPAPTSSSSTVSGASSVVAVKIFHTMVAFIIVVGVAALI